MLGLHPDYDSSYTPGEFSSESPCDTEGTHTVCNRLESAEALEADYIFTPFHPGQVVGVAVDGLSYTVEFYDGIQVL